MDSTVWGPVAHEHVVRMGLRLVAESEDAECPPDVGSSRAEGRPGLVQGLEASEPDRAEHPIADQEVPQHRQPGIVEDERLEEQGDAADWACHQTEYHCGVGQGVL